MVFARAFSRRRWAFGVAVVFFCVTAIALAQRRFGAFGGRSTLDTLANIPYDGRFTFVRVRYEPTPDGYWYGGLPAWAHGYPVAERHLMKIMNEVSFLGAHDEEVNAFALDDPALFK